MIKVAMLAHYPAQAILPAQWIKPRQRAKTPHPASWVEALCGALGDRDDVEVCVFMHSRAVNRHRTASLGRVRMEFIPKYEPGNVDPYSLFIPARIQLGRAIRAYQPDIVHGFGTESHNGLVAVSQPYPSVIFIQGIMEKLVEFSDLSAVRKKLQVYLERQTVRRASALIAETGFVRRWAEQAAPGVPVELIPHAGRSTLFDLRNTGSGSGRILCLSALYPHKGVDVVVRAFIAAAGRTSGRKATLVVAGSGPQLAELQQLADQAGLSDRIVFSGHLSGADVMKELCLAQFLVLGSRMDSSPNVITEAHAVGIPVLATDAGGIPDMIDDSKDGFVVPVDDADLLAARMLILLNNPVRCVEMGATGRKKVFELNAPEAVARQHVELYKAILNTKRMSGD